MLESFWFYCGISCLPALYLALALAYEDAMVRLKRSPPDYKFGYNYQWPLSKSPSVWILAILAIPVLNVLIFACYIFISIRYAIVMPSERRKLAQRQKEQVIAQSEKI